jgi:hypothetical protein
LAVWNHPYLSFKIILNEHFFCSGAMLYTLFFFDGVQIGNLKSLFRGVKIYEPRLVNLLANNVQLDPHSNWNVTQHCSVWRHDGNGIYNKGSFLGYLAFGNGYLPKKG